MAMKTIYICDKCGKQRDYNFLSSYEIHTDYCSDRITKRHDTKTLALCNECGDEIIAPFKDDTVEKG